MERAAAEIDPRDLHVFLLHLCGLGKRALVLPRRSRIHLERAASTFFAKLIGRFPYCDGCVNGEKRRPTVADRTNEAHGSRSTHGKTKADQRKHILWPAHLLVPPIRFERTTPALGERCSIPWATEARCPFSALPTTTNSVRLPSHLPLFRRFGSILAHSRRFPCSENRTPALGELVVPLNV